MSIVEVDQLSFEILNRHLLTEQEADATSVMSSERHPFMKDGNLSDIQLDELNQWYGHEFTTKETSIGTVLPQYRDQGVRFDRLRNSYVQNKPPHKNTCVGHTLRCDRTGIRES